MTMPKDQADQLARARQLIDEAAQHHRAACDAHDDGDDRALIREHAHLGRCLRSAQNAFQKIADLAAAQDIANSQQVQTSSGTGQSGGSENGRGSPLFHRGNDGIADWLDRARAGSRR